MKNFILLLITILFLVSCDKNDEVFDLTPQQLTGREYAISYSTIKFFSADSLEWRIERLSHNPYVTSYRLKYDLNGNRIQLVSRDTLRVDHSESNFEVVYYNDKFDGIFINNNTISGEISVKYSIYKDNLFDVGGGSSTADVNFKLK